MKLNSGYGLLARAVLFIFLGILFLWKASVMMPGSMTTCLWIFGGLDLLWAAYLLYTFICWRRQCNRRS